MRAEPLRGDRVSVKPALNPASLNIVRPELSRLLRQAQADFALAIQPGSDGQGLDACARALQQADGVLRLLELADAAWLARAPSARLIFASRSSLPMPRTSSGKDRFSPTVICGNSA